jgi:hypothetical protein
MHRLLVLIILIPAFTQSQIRLAKAEDYKAFIITKTLIVSHEDIFSEFNKVIKENLALFWEITDYEFIPFSEFEKVRKR